MHCLRCGSEEINSILPEYAQESGNVLWCSECGSTSFTDDLPDTPLEMWSEELDWRSEASDIDALRLNQREVLEAELQYEAEREEEARKLGTL